MVLTWVFNLQTRISTFWAILRIKSADHRISEKTK